MSIHLQRGLLLFEQQRWNDALEQFQQSLAAYPEETGAHSAAALTLLNLDRLPEAETHARAAIAGDPNDPDALYTLGRVLYGRQRLAEAIEAFDASLALDPQQPRVFGMRALIFCDLVRWKPALESAESGLAINPNCPTCLAGRSQALIGLGSADLAEDSLRSGLEQNVESPLLHASMGWAALAAKERDKALLHFGEALRLDPELEWAREGMLQALRTRHLFYRIVFSYYLWMARMTPGTRWGVIMAGYFGSRALSSLGRSQPEWQPYILPLIGVYVVFVYMTWTGESLGTLLLAWDKNGRRMLNEENIKEANLVGGLWGAALLCFLLEALTSQGLWILGAVCMLQVIPVSTTFSCQSGTPRKAMVAINIVLAATGIGGFVLGNLFQLSAGKVLLALYLPLFFISLIASNFLVASRPEK